MMPNIPTTQEEIQELIEKADGYISDHGNRYRTALYVKSVLVNGWQSDLTAARAEVQAETDALNAQIATLTQTITEKDAIIADLQAQLN